ncbi:MAG: inositol monophosphatase family protein [Actinomycetota bacterium]
MHQPDPEASAELPCPDPTDDHQLATAMAASAGAALAEMKEQALAAGVGAWTLRDRGDQLGHDLLTGWLAEHRPDDVVLSEEGSEDRRRLDGGRTWIVDPLDGTHDFPFRDSMEWAVHVALVTDDLPTAAAVAVPGMNETFSTATIDRPWADRPGRAEPLVICGRSNLYFAAEVADEVGGRVTACGSSGVKAMLVVAGAADVYVHASGLYEWDVCAPAAVAAAKGLVVSDIHGDQIVYNKRRPIVEGFVVARPELAAITRATLDRLL